jgi:hypothetical protein
VWGANPTKTPCASIPERVLDLDVLEVLPPVLIPAVSPLDLPVSSRSQVGVMLEFSTNMA